MVISPGGSVVYFDDLMQTCKRNTLIVYLEDTLPNILNRIPNTENRGIVGLKQKSIEEIYNERIPLYEKYADVTVICTGKRWEDSLAELTQIAEKHLI